MYVSYHNLVQQYTIVSRGLFVRKLQSHHTKIEGEIIKINQKVLSLFLLLLSQVSPLLVCLYGTSV